MIEKMTLEVRPYLPLKISEITWDGTSFHSMVRIGVLQL